MKLNELQEQIIRETIERSSEVQRERFTPAEIDHAVEVGKAFARQDTNWGQIADAGIAAVKTRRNSP